jgi:hypothetical protein
VDQKIKQNYIYFCNLCYVYRQEDFLGIEYAHGMLEQRNPHVEYLKRKRFANLPEGSGILRPIALPTGGVAEEPGVCDPEDGIS